MYVTAVFARRKEALGGFAKGAWRYCRYFSMMRDSEGFALGLLGAKDGAK
jgi:hypothetical protein